MSMNILSDPAVAVREMFGAMGGSGRERPVQSPRPLLAAIAHRLPPASSPSGGKPASPCPRRRFAGNNLRRRPPPGRPGGGAPSTATSTAAPSGRRCPLGRRARNRHGGRCRSIRRALGGQRRRATAGRTAGRSPRSTPPARSRPSAGTSLATLWPGQFLSKDGPGARPRPGRRSASSTPASRRRSSPASTSASARRRPGTRASPSLVRFYWNVTAEGAPELVARCSRAAQPLPGAVPLQVR